MKGNAKNTIRLNSMFIYIITELTINIFNRSLIIKNKPWPNISAILSMSVTVRVINIPTDESS